jgi:hypothetical protein
MTAHVQVLHELCSDKPASTNNDNPHIFTSKFPSQILKASVPPNETVEKVPFQQLTKTKWGKTLENCPVFGSTKQNFGHF